MICIVLLCRQYILFELPTTIIRQRISCGNTVVFFRVRKDFLPITTTTYPIITSITPRHGHLSNDEISVNTRKQPHFIHYISNKLVVIFINQKYFLPCHHSHSTSNVTSYLHLPGYCSNLRSSIHLCLW